FGLFASIFHEWDASIGSKPREPSVHVELHRFKQHAASHSPDSYLLARKTKFLRQANRLAAPVHEQLGRCGLLVLRTYSAPSERRGGDSERCRLFRIALGSFRISHRLTTVIS